MKKKEGTERDLNRIKAAFHWLALVQYGVLAILVAVAMYFALEK